MKDVIEVGKVFALYVLINALWGALVVWVIESQDFDPSNFQLYVLACVPTLVGIGALVVDTWRQS